MQKQNLINIFKLKGYVIDELYCYEHEICIDCHIRKQGMWHKGKYSKSFTETKVRRIDHMVFEGKPVVLFVKQRRFYFGKGIRRWEPLPNVKVRNRTSNIFQENTLRELQRDNYSATGFKRGKSGMYTSRLLDSLEFDLLWPESLTKLGLDGKSARGHQMIHNVTNLSDHKVATVLKDLTQAELKNFPH